MSRSKIAKGSLIMVVKRWTVRLLSVVSTVILARWLSPDEFGLLALALSFSVLFEVLAEFNFDFALIRTTEITDDHYHTAWTLNVLGNSFIALALGLSAPFLAELARAESATLVLQVIALCFFFDGLQNIGMVQWRKQLSFSQEFHLEFWRKVLEVGTALVWAWFSPTVWALVAGMAMGRFSGLALSYWLHPFRPHFCLIHWRELWSFSGWAVAFNFVNRMAYRVDHFLIARMANLTAVGFYSNAQMLSMLPTQEIVWPVTRALYPGFSSMLDDKPRLRNAYLNSLGGLLALSMPLAVGMAFTAQSVVRILLGEQWLEAAPLVTGLAIAQIVVLSASSAVPLLLALGKIRGLFVRSVFLLIYRAAFFYFALRWFGLDGAVWAVFASVLITTQWDNVMVLRALDIRWRRYGAQLFRPLMSVAVMSLILFYALPEPSDGSVIAALMHLLIAAAIGAPVYLICLLGSWHLLGRPEGLERISLQWVQERMAKSQT